jgi:hypothetical protein
MKTATAAEIAALESLGRELAEMILRGEIRDEDPDQATDARSDAA